MKYYALSVGRPNMQQKNYLLLPVPISLGRKQCFKYDEERRGWKGNCTVREVSSIECDTRNINLYWLLTMHQTLPSVLPLYLTNSPTNSWGKYNNNAHFFCMKLRLIGSLLSQAIHLLSGWAVIWMLTPEHLAYLLTSPWFLLANGSYIHQLTDIYRIPTMWQALFQVTGL